MPALVRAAIDPRACKRQPAACAVVQKVLERDPTLTFINGESSSHPFETPPHIVAHVPPFLPTCRSLRRCARADAALAAASAWTASAVQLVHTPDTVPVSASAVAAASVVPTAQRRDLCANRDKCRGGHRHRRRPRPRRLRLRMLDASIEFCMAWTGEWPPSHPLASRLTQVRSVQDERVRAEKCFAPIAPNPPPPPPVPQSQFAAMVARGLANRVHNGGTNRAEPANDLSSRAQYNSQAQAKQREQLAFLEGLAEDNHQLKDALSGIQERITGRRLWQRDYEHRSHDFDENVLRTVAFGGLPIAGVDIAECQALCEAMANATSGSECKAIAYARLNSDPRYVSLLEPTTPSFTHAQIYTMGQTTLGLQTNH